MKRSATRISFMFFKTAVEYKSISLRPRVGCTAKAIHLFPSFLACLRRVAGFGAMERKHFSRYISGQAPWLQGMPTSPSFAIILSRSVMPILLCSLPYST